MQNYYEGLENVFEDLTVDTRAADFQMERGEQQRANIMQGLRGAAGTSGVAGLAQALANQGQLQSQQIAAGIGQQERQNQILAAQQGARLQQLEAAGATQARSLEYGKTSTLLGMSQQRLGAANKARQDATNAIVGGVGNLAGAAASFSPGGSQLGKMLG